MSVITPEVEKIDAKINDLQKKIYLSDSDEEKEIFDEEIKELKAKKKAMNEKPMRISPVKSAPIIGDRLELRIQRKGRKSGSSSIRDGVAKF